MSADAALVKHIEERAQFVRTETIRLIEVAKVGHYASTFSCAEILATLYYGVMKLRRDEPDWPDRDRFLFGKGHAAVGLYPLLADWGFISEEVLNGYTRLGNPLGDHPDSTRVPGVDFSSGSLGHALSGGLGMALAARVQGRDHRVFCLLGDGEMHEGQIWEAAMGAAHHRATAITAIIDRNGFCLDGSVDDVIGIEPLAEKWAAFGWDTVEVDGHSVPELLGALTAPVGDRPRCIIARTVKGKGVSYMERDIGWHLGYLVPEDAADAVAEITGIS